MTINTHYECDFCRNQFVKREDVYNEVQLIGNKNQRMYADVCEKCLSKLATVIDKEFPKNIKAK